MSDVLKILNSNQISQKILRLSWQVCRSLDIMRNVFILAIGFNEFVLDQKYLPTENQP